MSDIVETDVLVIGSGLAGLLCTLKLVEAGINVILSCKTNLSDSATWHAQGGIAAAYNNTPTAIKLHLEDTIKAGAGLTDKKVAEEIITCGWQLIETLRQYQVNFDCLSDGSLSVAKEGGHSTARVFHYQDTTGKSICHGLIDKLKTFQSSPQLKVYEHTFANDLIIQDGTCYGAELIQNKPTPTKSTDRLITVLAKQTILATGGLGQVYSRTTNPVITTGDGIALAYKAGAALVDMEFVQFHPTALYLDDLSTSPSFLMSEAVRGAGAILLDHKGNRFMPNFHPDAELATRDIVARAIHQVMQETGQKNVFIDLRPIGQKTLEENFPNILHQLSLAGIDALKQLVPVSPAAHYFMGGIKADCYGQTSINNLRAIGECASTGLHGANRLASNSLLEAGVTAFKAAASIKNQLNTGLQFKVQRKDTLSSTPLMVPSNLGLAKQYMFHEVGIIRNITSLEKAINYFNNNISTVNYSIENAEAANILLLAKLIAESALRRKESRGSHYRNDYPHPNNEHLLRQVVHKSGHNWISVNNSD